MFSYSDRFRALERGSYVVCVSVFFPPLILYPCSSSWDMLMNLLCFWLCAAAVCVCCVYVDCKGFHVCLPRGSIRTSEMCAIVELQSPTHLQY